MVVPEEEMGAVSDACDAVVREAKHAGVWVFGGGIDESVSPVMVARDGTVTAGSYAQTRQLEGGSRGARSALPRGGTGVGREEPAIACRSAQDLRAFHYDPAS